MLLSEIATRVEGVRRRQASGGDPEIESVVIDSREVAPGALFVALPGARVDGHEFVEAAVDNGARAVVIEEDRAEAIAPSVPSLVAGETRRVLGPIAAEFYAHPSEKLRVIGVTGTNGKTTTTHLSAELLRATDRRVGVIGTVGVEWEGRRETTPNTTPSSLRIQQYLARMAAEGVDEVVMEVSSHGLATHRLEGTRFDQGVLTNLTREHLDFHGDMQAYRAAKAALFRRHLPEAAEWGKSPVAVLNADDPFGERLAGEFDHEGPVETARYSGRGGEADVSVEALETHLEGTVLGIECDGESCRVETSLLGEFNVENCAAAVAVALHAGLALEAICEALGDLPGVPGRMQRVGGAGDRPTVFVDYAHTPDALRRVLETLAPLAPGRLVVVFGCGGDRDRDKRPIMGGVAESVADLAVVTSDNPRTEEPEAIIEEILRGVATPPVDEVERLGEVDSGVWVEPERGRAIDETLRHARADDVVVIAGKGHEDYQAIDRERRPFDDRRRAERALEARR